MTVIIVIVVIAEYFILMPHLAEEKALIQHSIDKTEDYGGIHFNSDSTKYIYYPLANRRVVQDSVKGDTIYFHRNY